MWRRLVARYLGVVEAVGSSPVTQTQQAESSYELSALFFALTKAYVLVGGVDWNGDLLVAGQLKSPYFGKVLQNPMTCIRFVACGH